LFFLQACTTDEQEVLENNQERNIQISKQIDGSFKYSSDNKETKTLITDANYVLNFEDNDFNLYVTDLGPINMTNKNEYMGLLTTYEFVYDATNGWILNFNTKQKCRAEVNLSVDNKFIISLDPSENGNTEFNFNLSNHTGFSFSFDQPDPVSKREACPCGGLDGPL